MSDPRIDRIGTLLTRFSDGDLDAIDELVASDYFSYAPGDGEPTATEVHRWFAGQFKAAAPDLRLELRQPTEGPDGTISGIVDITGTWTNELWSVPPTGAAYEFELPVRVRSAEDGYAFEINIKTPEALGILRQLGVVNPPDEMHLPPQYPVDIPEFLFRLLFTGQVADKPCSHLADVSVVRSDATACQVCGPDEIYPTARLCLICGHLGCCDTSTDKHAKLHWEESGHPLIRSIRQDEGWIWCYEDNAFFERRTLERLAADLGVTL